MAGLGALGLQGNCSTPLLTEVFTAPRRTHQAIQRGADTDPLIFHPHWDSLTLTPAPAELPWFLETVKNRARPTTLFGRGLDHGPEAKSQEKILAIATVECGKTPLTHAETSPEGPGTVGAARLLPSPWPWDALHFSGSPQSRAPCVPVAHVRVA